MLLYQFLGFIIKVHQKEKKFGHLDFSNLYFCENKEEKARYSTRKTKKEEEGSASSRNFSGARFKSQRKKS